MNHENDESSAHHSDVIINFMKVLYLQGFSVLSNMIILFNYG